VIVDLTAEAGGNCELTEPDRVVVKHGVTIYGPTNLPTTMPVHASQLYTHNVTALLREFVTDGVLIGSLPSMPGGTSGFGSPDLCCPC
jgi:H+-translocating NAD(P) transhydrogenase subunit alpha